jgi:hypothetical protein
MYVYGVDFQNYVQKSYLPSNYTDQLNYIDHCYDNGYKIIVDEIKHNTNKVRARVTVMSNVYKDTRINSNAYIEPRPEWFTRGLIGPGP